MSNPDPAPLPNGGNDAVCFTSGPSGAPFAAGVIHAWLAVDREQPLVAAGISMGAISAAAMRRVYQELAASSAETREQKRWEWYRRYLTGVIQNPTAALWNAVPDPIDFFATVPPVKDLSVPESLCADSEDARRHYYLLTRLGIWLANLPIRLSTLATLVVMYVRKKEKYGDSVTRELLFYWTLAKSVGSLSLHILFRPNWIREGIFKGNGERTGVRPLFGLFWLINLAADCLFVCATWIVGAGISAKLLHSAAWRAFEALSIAHVRSTSAWSTVLRWSVSATGLAVALAVVSVCILLLIWLCTWADRHFKKAVSVIYLKMKKSPPRGGGFLNWLLRRTLFEPLDISRGLLHPYETKRQLYDLFHGHSPMACGPDDVQLLVVCAALERKEQVLLTPQLNVIEALSAAVAIPGIFPPRKMETSNIVNISAEEQASRDTYHLIDGSAIRTNPIPAFFDWSKQPANRTLVERLEGQSRTGPSLHVVYNVPISYPGSAQDAPAIGPPDIVQSVFQALELEKRRDTRQEVRQTNYMSKLEGVRRSVMQTAPHDRGPFVIYADEIAPREALAIDNSFSPDPNQLLKVVADGCRTTLESLYSEEIFRLTGGAPAPCSIFMEKIAHGRPKRSGFAHGLPEVCGSCAGSLDYRRPSLDRTSPEGVIQSYGNPGNPPQVDLHKQFNHLCGVDPKIIFLGSGGVFRGAFHIGVIAAMAETQLYPDLVIGASVGALMGGALCHIAAGPQKNEANVISRLTSLFLNVDTKVALTKTIKNATKQLATRARQIKLSPYELTRMVDRGSQADPGFAAIGAPPALIDALSSSLSFRDARPVRSLRSSCPDTLAKQRNGSSISCARRHSQVSISNWRQWEYPCWKPRYALF